MERRLTKQSLARALVLKAEIEVLKRKMISNLSQCKPSDMLCDALCQWDHGSFQQQSEVGGAYRNAGRGYVNVSYRERSDEACRGSD